MWADTRTKISVDPYTSTLFLSITGLFVLYDNFLISFDIILNRSDFQNVIMVRVQSDKIFLQLDIVNVLPFLKDNIAILITKFQVQLGRQIA